jgi:hypothetical protein
MEGQDLIRLLRARARGIGQRGWRCPAAARIAAYVDGKLEGRARRRVEAHVADCDFCLGQVASLVRLKQTETPADVPERLLDRAYELAAGRGGGTMRSAWRWGLAATATVVFAMVFAVHLHEPGPPVVSPQPTGAPSVEPSQPAPLETARSSPPSRKVRTARKNMLSPELIFPREGVALTPGDLEFRWKRMEGGLFYEVRLVTAAGDMVWEDRVETTQVRLPATVHLAPGEKYFVSVRAYLSQGKRTKSATVGFKVRNPS